MQTVSLPAIDDLPTLFPAVAGVNFAGDPTQIRCPSCDVNESYCHPSAVTAWPLTNEGLGVEITSRGVLFFRQGETSRGTRNAIVGTRGVIIAIRYDCESGHHFEERRQFHKGATFCDVATVACECHMVDTIWRD
jgi:hypothetical protein